MYDDDVQKIIYKTLTIFAVGVVVWLTFLLINACGFSMACEKAKQIVERTPVPTLIPATMPAQEMGAKPAATSDKCRIAAADLIGAWVSASAPETDAFKFTDADDRECEATYAEVEALFKEPNFWYAGSPACISCHSAELTISLAQLDLSSYAGIAAGSRRADADTKGTDILGAGKWESSLLYQFLSEVKDIPGHTISISKNFISAGKPLTPTATPTP